MPSKQKTNLVHRPGRRNEQTVRRHASSQNKVLSAVGYIIGSAVIALGLTYLPAVAGTTLTTPTHLVSDSVNRIHKGDRFTGVGFDTRWNALATPTRTGSGKNGVHPQSAHRVKSVQTIPFGCEPAFSPLVVVGNFSARCIAAIDTPKDHVAIS